MTRVGFVNKENNIDYMNYSDVNKYCEDLCMKEENLVKFKKFVKDYKYFNPYFDFVMFELKYVFLNPLLEEDKCLIARGNALYKYEYTNCNYDELMSSKPVSAYSYMTKCSNSELKLDQSTILDIPTAVIDPNAMHMMSYSGCYRGDGGSHETTCSTILNQMLIQDVEAEKHFIKSLENNEYTGAVLYLIEHFGFVIAYSTSYSGMLYGNKSQMNKRMQEFVEDAENTGKYRYEDSKKVVDEKLTDNYQKICK